MAISGNWNIEVEELAQKAAAVTNGFPDKDKTQVGVGYFRFDTPDGSKEVYINGTNNTLDGVANAVFVIVSILVIKDRTEGTGRFNLAAGALATMVGIGAALSNSLGGTLAQHLGYRASFLGLAAVALAAFAMLFFTIPETLPANP